MAIPRKELETKIDLAYPLGHGGREGIEMIPTEYVSGRVVAEWQTSYKMDNGWCFPKRVTKTDGQIEGKLWCRKSSIWKP